MTNQTQSTKLEEDYHFIQDEEQKLIKLDLMLIDYHTELSRLIQDLRRLRDRVQEVEVDAS